VWPGPSAFLSRVAHPWPSVREVLSIVRAHWSAIKTGYVGALTLYALIAPSFVHGAANAGFVVGLLALVPAVVISRHVVLRYRVPREAVLMDPSASSRRAQQVELASAEEEGFDPWWRSSPFETRWFEDFFAFWWKETTVPCQGVSIVRDQGSLGADDYVGIPDADVVPRFPARKKAVLVRMSPFFTDVDRRLHCATADWELTKWVDHHIHEFQRDNPTVSVFGVDGRLPHPGLICVHTIVSTADGWILFSLRSERTDYFPRSWSTTFEEQVEAGATATAAQQDLTVFDTIQRGLKEEFGDGLAQRGLTATCLAVGREHIVDEERGVLSCAVLAAARLDAPLRMVWESLSAPGQVEDIGEHAGWMACRFGTQADVNLLLKMMHPRRKVGLGPALVKDHARLGVDVSVHPDSSRDIWAPSGFGWHPTSRPRLYLWSRWAVRERILKPR